MTYDIRALLPEETGGMDGDGIPRSRSEMERWRKAMTERLPGWIAATAVPLLRDHLRAVGAEALVEATGDSLRIQYERVAAASTAYVQPAVCVEFGARSTGEPSRVCEVTCDAAAFLTDMVFPTAAPRTMTPERTFWEKATAAHVYCLSGRLAADRFARHWHDLVRLEEAGLAEAAMSDRALANAVALHKRWFFQAKDSAGLRISYDDAVNGRLQLEARGDARARLAEDYARMTDAGLLEDEALPFEALMDACRALQEAANRAAAARA